jgi:APA family basic amino acid/polyamine antiporter
MSTVIGQRFGEPFRELASNYLTAAVCFVPSAVMLIASEFLNGILKNMNLNRTVMAFFVLILCVIVISRGITTVGRLTLFFSSLTAALFVAGSIYSLSAQTMIFYPVGAPESGRFGYTLLLLFWAIIGWEVIGNYVEEVEKPELTIMRAMKISVGAIVTIYLLSAFALQNRIQLEGIRGAGANMSLILVPLFGDFAYILTGVIAAGLCFCTLLMILGAVTRQIAARAENGAMPSFLKMKPDEKAPRLALYVLSGWHGVLLILNYLQILTLEEIVGIANTFFIGNAILGLAASLHYIKGYWVKALVTALILALAILTAFSPPFAWGAFILVTALSLYQNSKKRRRIKDEQIAPD